MAALLGLAFALCLCTFPSTSIVTAAAVSSANDGSVLEAILESQYSEWMELVERAQMLHPLEQLVGSGAKLTIFAPLNHQLHPQIKAFVLQPSNAHLLKEMVQFHVLAQRVTQSQWRATTVTSLAGHSVNLRTENQPGGSNSNNNVKMYVGEAEIVAPDCILRADGVVHGVDQMLLPMSVQREYVAFSTRHLATPLPTGAPGMDNTRRVALAKPQVVAVSAPSTKAVTEKHKSISPVSAPSPFSAPGPAMGPSGAYWYDVTSSVGEKEVTTFIMALQRFGGYGEFAGLLVDMTSLGSEISKLVNQGYKLTILAPDDAAWKDALTEEQLTSPTEIEHILHYHVITEYQTEESLYTTLRRNGKTSFSTLRTPFKLTAHETDGQVVFGEGDMGAGVFDLDIHADGCISVQGIDKVLIPPTETTTPPAETKPHERSVLEMLQLPSRASIVGNGGPGRTVTGATTISAVSALLLLFVIHILV